MRKFAPLALTLAALATPQPAHAGACAMPPPAVIVLTAPDGVVTATGGIVAEIETEELPKWTFRVTAGKQEPVSFTKIAPGLYRIAVPAAGTLEDASHAQLAHVTLASAEPRAIAARAVRVVEHAQSQTRRGVETSVSAELTTGSGGGALALVAFAADDNHPRAWAKAGPPQVVSLSLFDSGSCVPMRPGLEEPQAGEKVRLAWIDTAGRLSAPTPVLTIKTAK